MLEQVPTISNFVEQIIELVASLGTVFRHFTREIAALGPGLWRFHRGMADRDVLTIEKYQPITVLSFLQDKDSKNKKSNKIKTQSDLKLFIFLADFQIINDFRAREK